MNTADLDIFVARGWAPRVRSVLAHVPRPSSTALRVWLDERGMVRLGVWALGPDGWRLTGRGVRIRRHEIAAVVAALGAVGRRAQ